MKHGGGQGTPAVIAGLYNASRSGVDRVPEKTLAEIPQSLAVNPEYRRKVTVLAGDREAASQLHEFGLQVYHVFDDVPESIRRDSVHLMKHWMCLWAVKKFGEILWVDWDTVCLRWPDREFWGWCRRHGTPKFVWVPDYWATVNCGVYYVSATWARAMEGSFSAEVDEPNDELLWRSILPKDVRSRKEFWFGDRVVHVWTDHSLTRVSARTCFAHVKDFSFVPGLLSRCPPSAATRR